MRRIYVLIVGISLILVGCNLLFGCEVQSESGAKADTVAARYHHRHRRGRCHRIHRVWG